MTALDRVRAAYETALEWLVIVLMGTLFLEVTVGVKKWADLPADVRSTLEAVAKETQAFVYEKAAKDDAELLGKLKAGGMQVNMPNKDAFIAASKPVYEEYSKEVNGAKEVIDRAIALGK